MKDLTEEENTALTNYRSSESYKVNAKLRDGGKLTETEQNMVNALDSALEKLPIHEGTVYRRLSFDMEGQEALNAFLAAHEPETVVRSAAYTSSSVAIDGYPVSGELTVTQIISCKTGRDMAGIGNNNESEILFARNTRFYVEKVRTNANGETVIYMEEIAKHGTGQLYSEEHGQAMQQMQTPAGKNGELQGVPGVDTRQSSDGRGLPEVRGEGEAKHSLKTGTLTKSYSAILEENRLLREQTKDYAALLRRTKALEESRDYWQGQTRRTQRVTTDQRAVEKAIGYGCIDRKDGQNEVIIK